MSKLKIKANARCNLSFSPFNHTSSVTEVIAHGGVLMNNKSQAMVHEASPCFLWPIIPRYAPVVVRCVWPGWPCTLALRGRVPHRV